MKKNIFYITIPILLFSCSETSNNTPNATNSMINSENIQIQNKDSISPINIPLNLDLLKKVTVNKIKNQTSLKLILLSYFYSNNNIDRCKFSQFIDETFCIPNREFILTRRDSIQLINHNINITRRFVSDRQEWAFEYKDSCFLSLFGGHDYGKFYSDRRTEQMIADTLYRGYIEPIRVILHRPPHYKYYTQIMLWQTKESRFDQMFKNKYTVSNDGGGCDSTQVRYDSQNN